VGLRCSTSRGDCRSACEEPWRGPCIEVCAGVCELAPPHPVQPR
jgi:hypothetical protein